MSTRTAPKARRSRLRSMIVGVSAVVVGLGLSIGGAGQAFSAPGDPGDAGLSPEQMTPGWIIDDMWSGNGHSWAGAEKDPEDQSLPAWCTQGGYPAPKPGEVESKGLVWDVTGAQDNAPAKFHLSVPELAYLLQKYEDEAIADTRAALSLLVHYNIDEGMGQRGATPQQVIDIYNTKLPLQTWWADVEDLMIDLVDEAKAAVVDSFGATSVTGAGTLTGSVTADTPTNDEGDPIPGLPYTVELTGPATFLDGSTSKTGTTTSAASISYDWKSTANGRVTWKVTYTDLPRKSLTSIVTQEDNAKQVQNLVTIKERPASDPASKAVEGEAFDVLFDFQPQATSNVGSSKVVDGNKIEDSLTTFADPDYGDGEWIKVDGNYIPVKFEGTAYYTGDHPATQQATVPAGAKVVGTAEVIANGPGTYSASIETDIDPSFITWVWKVAKANQGDNAKYVADDWSDAFGIANETTSKRRPVDVDTSIVVRPTKTGEYLIDDVFVTGLPDDHPNWAGSHGFAADVKTFSQKLLFFPKGVEVVDANVAQAEVIGEVTIPAANGFYPSVGSTKFKVKDGNPEGTYVFVTSFAGDARVAPFASSVTDQNEQYVVTEEKPELGTTATDASDGDHSVSPLKEVTINDNVCYKGLKPGTEYTFTGVLMDKETGQPIQVDGKNVESSKKFTPTDAEGCETVTFTFNAWDLGGKTTVVFERAYTDGKLVGAHTDLEDEGQTVTIEEKPKLSTTATDASDGDHSVSPLKEITINDNVCYKGLKPGTEYTFTGVLMDKETGKPVEVDGKKVESSKKFTPTDADGCETVTFTFNGWDQGGKEFVVFEKAFIGETLVADHEDINDKDQTVTFEEKPELATTATDAKDGDHSISPDQQVTINDKVCYKGLKPGSEYTFTGVLMDKATNQPIQVDGKNVESSKKFTPGKADGCETVTFTFNASSLGGKTTVVFEKAFIGETLVADHEDINDKDQTVTVENPPTPATGLADTGAHIGIVALLGALTAGGTGTALLIRNRRQRN